MKNILLISIIFVLYSCTPSVGQKPSIEQKKEEEFIQLMKKVNEVRLQNKNIIQEADNKTKTVIQKTSEKIETLKDENKKLKQEINETGKNFYPINDTVTDIKFTLRPVSDSKENR